MTGKNKAFIGICIGLALIILYTFLFQGKMSKGNDGLITTLIIFFIIIADGVIWGFVTRAIVKGKGYEKYNSWFWCGFFLALIGVIVAACKPAVNTTQSYAPVPVQPQASDADELKKYKELLDSGAITQEEYDAKKKQLLNI